MTASLTAPELTESQIASFRRDGFVLVRQAFGAAAAADFGRWAEELTALPEEPGKHWVFHEKSLTEPGRDLISRIENIAPHHDGYAALARALEAPAGQLMGEPAVLFKEKINFKMPGGDGFKPHQDSQAGWEDYASYFVSVAVAIDPATEENGCLMVAAGHQARGLYRAWEPLSDEDMTDMNFVPCRMAPGDMVMFDSYTPHGSEPNLSKTIRRVYFATYNRASEGDHLAQYYADKHKNYPPDIERDPNKEYVFRV